MGITIGGASYDNWLNRASLTHTSTYGPEPDQLAFMLNPGAPEPAVSSDVVYTLPDGERLFGGVYTGAPESLRGFMATGLAVGCLDWRIRADALTLNDRFYDATAGAIIVELFKRYAPQFDTSLVDLSGIKIPQIRFKRDAKITAALDALSNLTGWVWDIDPLRRVRWGPPGSIAAPFTMSDTSRNFEDLVVEVNRDQLRNRIIVRGGSTPSSTKTIDRFAGDGLRSSWPLTAIPHGLEAYELFKGDFGSGISPNDWIESDVNNPVPPAGHPNAAGYLITTAQTGAVLSQTGWLQILGGNSLWGAVRLMAFQVLGRGDGRRFEWEFSAGSAVGQGRCGLWDPNQQGALAGEQYGFFFDNGTIKPSIGGVAQAAANVVNYAANTLFRLRIIPKAAGGATMWVNKDATGNMALPEAERVAWRASQWVLLFDTATGNAANFAFCGIFNHSFVGRMRRARAFNRLYGAKLTIGGVEKVVGLLRVDEDSGCDALVGTTTGDLPLLSFFPDTRPANGVAGVFEYFEGIPVHVQVSDGNSIAALAAIENDPLVPPEKRGVVEHYIEDASITTRKMAIARGQQEIEQFGNPLVNVTFRTRATGLRAGQVFNAALTKLKSGRALAGAFLIQQVVTSSLGSGNFRATVAASSRLKGIQDYLLELLALGRRMDLPQDDNSPIEDLIFAGDALGIEDAGSVSGPAVTGADGLEFIDMVTLESGPVGPYYYDDPVSASFARNSAATWLGVSYAANAPRFVAQGGYTGILIEQGANNLMPIMDPIGGGDILLANGPTYAPGELSPYFAGGVRFPATPTGGQTLAAAYRSPLHAANTTYTLSAFVEMDDGGAPVPSSSTATGDFRMVGVNGYANVGNIIVDHIEGNIYRVSGQFTTPAAIPAHNSGIYKYATQSTRTFVVSGIQIEPGSIVTSPIQGGRAAENLSLQTQGIVDASAGKFRARFRLDRAPGVNLQVIWDPAGSGSPGGMMLYVAPDAKVYFQVYGAGGSVRVLSGGVVAKDTWYDVEAEWLPTGIALSLDGAPLGSVTGWAPTIALNASQFFGCQGGNQRWLGGLLAHAELEQADGRVTRIDFDGAIAITQPPTAQYGLAVYLDE